MSALNEKKLKNIQFFFAKPLTDCVRYVIIVNEKVEFLLFHAKIERKIEFDPCTNKANEKPEV